MTACPAPDPTRRRYRSQSREELRAALKAVAGRLGKYSTVNQRALDEFAAFGERHREVAARRKVRTKGRRAARGRGTRADGLRLDHSVARASDLAPRLIARRHSPDRAGARCGGGQHSAARGQPGPA